MDASDGLSGSCLCGAVAFEVRTPINRGSQLPLQPLPARAVRRARECAPLARPVT